MNDRDAIDEGLDEMAEEAEHAGECGGCGVPAAHCFCDVEQDEAR